MQIGKPLRTIIAKPHVRLLRGCFMGDPWDARRGSGPPGLERRRKRPAAVI
jgi:hypothetical protein